MKWFFFLTLAALITFGILNKEKLPFLNKEDPLDKSSAPITENDNDAETNNNEPENINKNEPPLVDPIEEKYPMPEFQPIEQLVGNWKQIPPSAFPRKVTLKAKAKYIFAGGAGSSTAPAGAKTFAISLSGEKLVITPNTQSNVRGTISIDDTDYKEILGEEYEKYKQRKKKEVYARRVRAREIAESEIEPAQETSSTNTSQSRPNQVTSISRIPKDQLSDYENEIGEMPEAIMRTCSYYGK